MQLNVYANGTVYLKSCIQKIIVVEISIWHRSEAHGSKLTLKNRIERFTDRFTLHVSK